MADASQRRAYLYRDWVHVREEDRPGEMVFLPEQAERPPASGRGGDELRTRIAFREDGSCRVSGIGSDDIVTVVLAFVTDFGGPDSAAAVPATAVGPSGFVLAWGLP